MRATLVAVFLTVGALSCQAQEKVMNVVKTDGTSAQTRVADLKQIKFLTVEQGGQGLLVTTTDGETAAVLFETNPVVTISDGKLIVKSASADDVQFEIDDIAEMKFGNASDATAIDATEGFACVLQDGGVLLRGIPANVEPRVCSIDGRSIPTPAVADGCLLLNRRTLGSGIFVVKAGSFSAKVCIGK